MFAAENTMLGWLYREIDVANVTAPIWIQPIRPSESFDWILERLQVQYDSDGSDPSVFANVEWKLSVQPQTRSLQEETVKIPLTLNSGINDLTAGTTRPKEFYFKSPKIDWPIKALEQFEIELRNFTDVTIIKVLFIGHFIFPEPVLRNV